jgi:hypothetical protein
LTADARDAGDGDSAAVVRDYEADAIGFSVDNEPTRIDTNLRRRLEESFSHDQILQLTLEVSCWNYQKLLVALAIAQPANPDFLTLVTLDEHGVIHHGELLDY